MIQQPKWKNIEYSFEQVDRAGKAAANNSFKNISKGAVKKVIDNWRAAHAYPMHVIYMNLRRLVNRMNQSAVQSDRIIVVERLKRYESIVGKLQREKKMKLTRMQDIEGCRFIVPTIEDVYDYSKKFKRSRIRHILKKENDYIKSPKSSGYRSLHLIYQFHSDKKETYNKHMYIEIQFRTKLQHIWGTAVETLGLIVGEELKEGQGNNQYLKFMSIISKLFMSEEMKDTNINKDELIYEIREIDRKFHILAKLNAAKLAISRNKVKSREKKGYYLLSLSYVERKLDIKYFKPSENERANQVYNSIENKAQTDTVLVGAESFRALRRAYPNYFSDIRLFVQIVSKYINNNRDSKEK